MCCRSLFVVERITVTDLVANKISGSGSCLIGKLQNSPHNCETSCCLACCQREGNHELHVQINEDMRTICTLNVTLTNPLTYVSLFSVVADVSSSL